MTEQFTCKTLLATYSSNKIVLYGPISKTICIKKGTVNYYIHIEQCISRTIKIESSKDVTVFTLNAILTKIERLLMIFDGFFIPITSLKFTNSIIYSNHKLDLCGINLKSTRLSYFESADFVLNRNNQLIEFEKVLTPKVFEKWEQLLDSLDIVHQVYLYALSNSTMPVDIKCSFLIETAEPLIEILQEQIKSFKPFSEKEEKSLRKCLDILISKYGKEIFKKEITLYKDEFLKTLVRTRVRIMHIKKNQNKYYLNGSESLIYISKISLMYRKVIFTLLKIPENLYNSNLLKYVNILNNLNSTVEHFLVTLSNEKKGKHKYKHKYRRKQKNMA